MKKILFALTICFCFFGIKNASAINIIARWGGSANVTPDLSGDWCTLNCTGGGICADFFDDGTVFVYGGYGWYEYEVVNGGDPKNPTPETVVLTKEAE